MKMIVVVMKIVETEAKEKEVEQAEVKAQKKEM